MIFWHKRVTSAKEEHGGGDNRIHFTTVIEGRDVT